MSRVTKMKSNTTCKWGSASTLTFLLKPLWALRCTRLKAHPSRHKHAVRSLLPEGLVFLSLL